jgi:hypothetical protein
MRIVKSCRASCSFSHACWPVQFDAEGPKAMLRGAATYGGLTLLLSGGFGGSKRPALFDYDDKVIDF